MRAYDMALCRDAFARPLLASSVRGHGILPMGGHETSPLVDTRFPRSWLSVCARLGMF